MKSSSPDAQSQLKKQGSNESYKLSETSRKSSAKFETPEKSTASVTTGTTGNINNVILSGSFLKNSGLLKSSGLEASGLKSSTQSETERERRPSIGGNQAEHKAQRMPVTHGTLKFKDDSIYLGEIRGNMPHGRGRLTMSNGAKFEGEWENGKQIGFGREYSPKGTVVYQGEWRSGKYHGYGTLTRQSDLSEQDKKNLNYQDLSNIDEVWLKYEGQFREGHKHGYGSLAVVGGAKFVGTFMHDRINGRGTFFSKDKIVAGDWIGSKLILQDKCQFTM